MNLPFDSFNFIVTRLESQLLAKGDSYKNACMHGQQKQVFSVVIYTVKQFIKQFCKRPNSKKTQELIKAMPCVYGASKGLHRCLLKYSGLLDGIAKWTDFKQQVAHLCWYVH